MDRYAVIGWPLDYTRSPQIHRLFADHCGEALSYEAQPISPENLASTLEAFLKQPEMCGFNVTVPHKESVMARCDALSDEADEAGAVNTVVIERSARATRLIGHNTDGAGLVQDLTQRHGVSLDGAEILMVGAGGAARGTCGPLLRAGCASLHVLNRTPARAQALVEHLRTRADAPRLAAITHDAVASHGPYDLVINATSAGLGDDVPALPEASVRGAFCYDMLYGKETPFERWAAGEGAHRVATGLGMLVEQAAEAFRLWRGVRPPTDAVFDLLR
ncbi:MAG: shikimate dehydrogenase [Pseudomonadota bacterium]